MMWEQMIERRRLVSRLVQEHEVCSLIQLQAMLQGRHIICSQFTLWRDLRALNIRKTGGVGQRQAGGVYRWQGPMDSSSG